MSSACENFTQSGHNSALNKVTEEIKGSYGEWKRGDWVIIERKGKNPFIGQINKFRKGKMMMADVEHHPLGFLKCFPIFQLKPTTNPNEENDE